MIDLDIVHARFDKAAAHRWPYSTEHAQVLAMSAGDVPLLVAELRAAREVVEAARAYPVDGGGPLTKLHHAVVAYDKAVGS